MVSLVRASGSTRGAREGSDEGLAAVDPWRSVALLRLGKKRNLITSSGHAVSQLRHMWHSSCRHFTPPCGLSAPWQSTRQRLQSVHFEWSFSMPNTAWRAITPSVAPSGQSARHQKRGIQRLARSTANRSPPITQVWWKKYWRGWSTVATSASRAASAPVCSACTLVCDTASSPRPEM